MFITLDEEDGTLWGSGTSRLASVQDALSYVKACITHACNDEHKAEVLDRVSLETYPATERLYNAIDTPGSEDLDYEINVDGVADLVK